IGVKKRFADDPHGEREHLLIEINDGPIPPRVLQVFTVRSHESGIVRNMARLEGRSHEFPLVVVKSALAREDAIAKDRAKALLADQSFVEGVGLFNQNPLNLFWCVEEDAGERTQTHVADIACLCEALQEAQTIFAKIGHTAEKWRPTKSGKRLWSLAAG